MMVLFIVPIILFQQCTLLKLSNAWQLGKAFNYVYKLFNIPTYFSAIDNGFILLQFVSFLYCLFRPKLLPLSIVGLNAQ